MGIDFRGSWCSQHYERIESLLRLLFLSFIAWPPRPSMNYSVTTNLKNLIQKLSLVIAVTWLNGVTVAHKILICIGFLVTWVRLPVRPSFLPIPSSTLHYILICFWFVLDNMVTWYPGSQSPHIDKPESYLYISLSLWLWNKIIVVCVLVKRIPDWFRC